eukprot:10748211-Lingulodinium_polyedra.AAC.1
MPPSCAPATLEAPANPWSTAGGRPRPPRHPGAPPSWPRRRGRCCLPPIRWVTRDPTQRGQPGRALSAGSWVRISTSATRPAARPACRCTSGAAGRGCGSRHSPGSCRRRGSRRCCRGSASARTPSCQPDLTTSPPSSGAAEGCTARQGGLSIGVGLVVVHHDEAGLDHPEHPAQQGRLVGVVGHYVGGPEQVCQNALHVHQWCHRAVQHMEEAWLEIEEHATSLLLGRGHRLPEQAGVGGGLVGREDQPQPPNVFRDREACPRPKTVHCSPRSPQRLGRRPLNLQGRQRPELWHGLILGFDPQTQRHDVDLLDSGLEGVAVYSSIDHALGKIFAAQRLQVALH